MRFVIVIMLVFLCHPAIAQQVVTPQSCLQTMTERFKVQFQTDAALQRQIADLKTDLETIRGEFEEYKNAAEKGVGHSHHKRKHRHARERRLPPETSGGDSIQQSGPLQRLFSR